MRGTEEARAREGERDWKEGEGPGIAPKTQLNVYGQQLKIRARKHAHTHTRTPPHACVRAPRSKLHMAEYEKNRCSIVCNIAQEVPSSTTTPDHTQKHL